jgi:CubicO group peptidase (beta-lactamase class C family)
LKATKKSFEKCSPEQQQMNSSILEVLRKKLKGEKILGCLVLRNDSIVFGFYKNNKIEPETHHINSCTKSIISALTGICLKKGFIKDINTPIIHYFGDMIDIKSDQRKGQITIYHLLTMTTGFYWPEFGEWHYFAPMRYNKDIIRFILDRELESDPGTKMNYNSGSSHLITAIIQRETGAKAIEVAQQYLFNPLGITDTRWYEMQGVNLGADGLKLKLIDMLKFGYLYLNKGSFFGREIVSEDWVTESVIPRFLTYHDIGSYGYHFWTSSIKNGEGKEIPYYFAMGFGGQYIIIVPEYNMVSVFVSRDFTDTLLPMRLFREYIMKSV